MSVSCPFPSVGLPHPTDTRQVELILLFFLFLCCTKLEKEDFLENLHVLSCFIQLQSLLLISCVFWSHLSTVIVIVNQIKRIQANCNLYARDVGENKSARALSIITSAALRSVVSSSPRQQARHCGDGFILACEEFEKMFDQSFSACSFFSFSF